MYSFEYLKHILFCYIDIMLFIQYTYYTAVVYLFNKTTSVVNEFKRKFIEFQHSYLVLLLLSFSPTLNVKVLVKNPRTYLIFVEYYFVSMLIKWKHLQIKVCRKFYFDYFLSKIKIIEGLYILELSIDSKVFPINVIIIIIIIWSYSVS